LIGANYSVALTAWFYRAAEVDDFDFWAMKDFLVARQYKKRREVILA